MESIRDYVCTALNGIRQRFNKLEKDFDKKLDDKLGRDELPPPQPQIQSDWNESNEESVAYVCNRPFYDDIVVKTYTYENVGTSGQGALMMDADFKGNFIPGETYTVAVNGSAMNIVAITDKYGDVALYPDGDSTSSRIYVNHVYGWLQAFTWWNPGSTVSITGPFRTLKQIDNKFLNAVTSINGETGDVVINADTLGTASSKNKRYEIDGRWTGAHQSFTPVTRNWTGLGSGELTGLVLGNVIAYDDIDDDLSVVRFTFIPDIEKQAHTDNEDVVIRGVADPTALNDATSKSYVDGVINGISNRFASVDRKLDNTIPAPATATVGQTIVVKSVDENGKPTAWEPTDFPDSGYPLAGNYELIETIVCDGTYGNISRTKLSLKKVKIVLNMKAASAATTVCTEAYNDAGLFGYSWIGNCINTGERFATSWFVSDGMNAYAEFTSPGSAKYNTGGVNRTVYPLNADTPINKLGIYTSPKSNVFPAESTIEIWGVRA